jgi:uncharacterized protein (DUF1330 family)
MLMTKFHLKRPAMSLFVFAKFAIHDRAGYNRYVELATPIFLREGVKVHGSDDAPQDLTPDMKADKAVLLEFRDKAHFEHFFNQEDYIAAAKHRNAASRMSATSFQRFVPV